MRTVIKNITYPILISYINIQSILINILQINIDEINLIYNNALTVLRMKIYYCK